MLLFAHPKSQTWAPTQAFSQLCQRWLSLTLFEVFCMPLPMRWLLQHTLHQLRTHYEVKVNLAVMLA